MYLALASLACLIFLGRAKTAVIFLTNIRISLKNSPSTLAYFANVSVRQNMGKLFFSVTDALAKSQRLFVPQVSNFQLGVVAYP